MDSIFVLSNLAKTVTYRVWIRLPVDLCASCLKLLRLAIPYLSSNSGLPSWPQSVLWAASAKLLAWLAIALCQVPICCADDVGSYKDHVIVSRVP